MSLTAAQIKGRIRNIANETKADPRLLMRNRRYWCSSKNHWTSDEVQNLWNQYQKKYPYAYEISFEEVIDSIKELSSIVK